MKTCTHCGEAKPSTEFYTELRNKDGMTARCKQCQRAAGTANRAKPRIRASLLLGGAKSRARSKSIPCTLTRDWVESRIIAGVCEATGKPFDLGPPSVGSSWNLWSPSIDQREPSRGYTPENCRLVVTGYNLLKNDCPEHEALRFLAE